MSAYQRCAAAVVERYEGHIAEYLGDGGLVQAIAQLDPHAAVRLRARIGIATGRVVVGDLVGEGAAREEAVDGDGTESGGRAAGAEPEATRRLLGGLFQLDDLGPQCAERFAEPLRAWRVVGRGLGRRSL
jgi:class 3 adenylate cyclase